MAFWVFLILSGIAFAGFCMVVGLVVSAVIAIINMLGR